MPATVDQDVVAGSVRDCRRTGWSGLGLFLISWLEIGGFPGSLIGVEPPRDVVKCLSFSLRRQLAQ